MSKRKDRIEAKDIEQIIILFITAVGLFGLLSYTFWHTSHWFGRYISPPDFGYGAAIGAELIIVMMSYKLAKSRSGGFLYFALIGALFISAWANYYEGFATYHRTEPNTITWWANFDIILFVSSLLATGLISLLVFAVTDILSGDVTTVSNKVEKVLQSFEQAEQKPEKVEHPITISPNTNDKEFEVHRAIIRLSEQGEKVTNSAVAAEAGCAVSTANKWMATYHNGK